MSCCHYAILPEYNLLFVKGPSGHLGNEDLLSKIQVYEDPAHRAGMDEIHDYGETTSTNVYPEIIRLFADLVVANEAKFRDGRVLFVRHRDLGHTFLEMFCSYFAAHPDSGHYRFEIVPTMDAALEYLGLPSDLSFDQLMKPLVF